MYNNLRKFRENIHFGRFPQTHGFPDQLEKYNDCYTTYLNPIIVVGQMYNNLNYEHINSTWLTTNQRSHNRLNTTELFKLTKIRIVSLE